VILVNHAFGDLGETWIGALAAQFTLFSLITIFISVAPTRSFLLSDGTQIRMLLRSDGKSRSLISILALAKLYQKGVRAKEWKHTWLRRAMLCNEPTFHSLLANWFAYMSASDREDEIEAAACLERSLAMASILPHSIRDIVAQEAAFFCAWFRSDSTLARQWLTQVKKRQKLPELVRARLDVAFYCSEHNYEAADSSWQRGIALVKATTGGAVRKSMEETWIEWRDLIKQHQIQFRNCHTTS
jgi:hypothetical protein